VFQVAPASSVPAAGLARRAAVTAGAVAVLLIGERVPVPGVDWEAFRNLSGYGAGPQLTWLALGLAPFASAFLFVELTAAVLPRLRGLRGGTARERLPLTLAAWALSAALVAWQAWGLAVYLQGVRDSFGFPLLASGLGPVLGATAALLLGTLALGCVAALVSRHGLGNGFAVLFGADALERALHLGRRVPRVPRELWSDTALLVVMAVLFVTLLVASHLRRHSAGIVPLVPVPTCGLAVVDGPSAALTFLWALSGWVPSLAVLAETLETGSRWITLGNLLFTAALALLFARLFCPPGAVVQAFRRAAPGRTEEKVLLGALAAANRRSLVLVMGVALFPTVSTLVGVPVRIVVGDLFDVAIVIAVALDLETEVKARADGALVSARAVHSVHAVPPTMQALAAAGIRGVARTLRYRTLFHLFAPYAPIEILVPPERAADAEAICAMVVSGAPAPRGP
jgi:SecY